MFSHLSNMLGWSWSLLSLPLPTCLLSLLATVWECIEEQFRVARMLTAVTDLYLIQGVTGGTDQIWEGVPYVKLYWYNPKHVCPKLNGYWDNGQIKLWTSFGSTNDSCQLVSLIYIRSPVRHTNSADGCLKCISLHMSGTQTGSQQAGWRHRSAFQCDV